MKLFKPFSYLGLLLLGSCIGGINGNPAPDYPYFITTEAMMVKKILVPKGTKLVYEESYFNKGKIEHKLSEKKLITIEFPSGQELIWGGVPVKSIDKFFNSEMHGYSVLADFDKLKDNQKTRFSELWQSCGSEMGITIKNTDDWSFNVENIADVESCSVIYQRYFKEDKNQQDFLNEMLTALRKISLKQN